MTNSPLEISREFPDLSISVQSAPQICIQRGLLYGFRLTVSGRDSLRGSKQLSSVIMNCEGASHDDDSRAFERRGVA